MLQYRTIILPVALYGCETWSLTLREERRLRVFENGVLSRIFGPKRDEDKKNEMGGACGMHVGFWWGSVREGDQFNKNLGVVGGGGEDVKWIPKKQGGGRRPGSFDPRAGTGRIFSLRVA